MKFQYTMTHIRTILRFCTQMEFTLIIWGIRLIPLSFCMLYVIRLINDP